jgi:site-specific recombinase XerD
MIYPKFIYGGNAMESIASICESIARILESRGFKVSTVKKHWRYWNKLSGYLEEKDLKSYDAKIGLDFLSDVYGITIFTGLDREDKWIVRSVQYLNDYLKSGVIFPATPRVSTIDSLTWTGEYLVSFKRYQTEKHNITQTTLDGYDKNIGKFLLYLESRNIASISKMTPKHVFNFCEIIAKQSEGVAHNIVCSLRVFLRYLYTTGIYGEDFSQKVPSFAYSRKSKLPSVLTSDEKRALVESIDRTDNVGKRDYAIILAALRLGLRSGDIRLLKFDNIHWEKNTIELVQQKTGNPLVLPLLEDVGQALIDYIRYARPNTDSPIIFQTFNAPINPLSAPAMSCIVKKYARKAAIDSSVERHLGPHLMRNTLASALLEENVPLPEISGILGHSTSRTTQEYYLRIDIKQLRRCALEAPPFSWDPIEEVF